ncbi:hypothetical protein ANN_21051 [Periplaneta americana]|uniref:DUF4817 domain-containing protein n=1 Tax=Periplaneta americana TaxID=6978 RepID=A0ABQ8SEA6_PERAM|nr:hypothetical protein ANN_21051 [Periplaneta americana]
MSKMATTNQQRAQCVLWYAKFESVKRVQKGFRHECGVRNVPKYGSILLWFRTFVETGSVLKNMQEVAGETSTRSNYVLAWTPNSPDLTPPDFFVWGFVKDIVYSQKRGNIDDLRCVELEHVRRKYLPPSMLSQNRSSLACFDLMGNREWEQKIELFLLKARKIRTSAVEVSYLFLSLKILCRQDRTFTLDRGKFAEFTSSVPWSKICTSSVRSQEVNNTSSKRAKKAQPLVFTVERAEAGGGNRDAT